MENMENMATSPEQERSQKSGLQQRATACDGAHSAIPTTYARRSFFQRATPAQADQGTHSSCRCCARCPMPGGHQVRK